MKNIFYLILIVNIFVIDVSCFAQNPFLGDTKRSNPNTFENWQDEDLICKAMKLVTVKFMQTEKFGEAIDIAEDSVIVFFNDKGSYLGKYVYLLDKLYLKNYDTYEYYDDSECLKINNGRNSKGFEYKYNYSCSNNLIESVVFHRYDSDLTEKYIYQYDSKGNKIKFELYKVTGRAKDETIVSIYMYEYNSNNKITEIKKYNSEGNLIESYKFKYDLKGNLILREMYDHSYKMELKQKSEFTYDSKNNILLELYYGIGVYGHSSSVRYTYTYNSTGTIKEVMQRCGSSWHKIEYVAYDSKGNWVQKNESDSFNKPFKVKRLIVY